MNQTLQAAVLTIYANAAPASPASPVGTDAGAVADVLRTQTELELQTSQ